MEGLQGPLITTKKGEEKMPKFTIEVHFQHLHFLHRQHVLRQGSSQQQ